MFVDILLLISGIICIAAGLLGCIIPAMPGPPLSYIALLLIHFTKFADFSVKFLLITAGITVIVTVLDFVFPAWGTKKLGGSSAGTIGSIIGLIVGLFFLPLGILLGPFAGAVVGELIIGRQTGDAFRSGLGSFLGFIFGTAMKLAVCFAFTFYFIKEIIV